MDRAPRRRSASTPSVPLPDGAVAYTEQQLADILGKSRAAVRSWYTKRLPSAPPFVRVGNSRIYLASSIEKWLKARETTPDRIAPAPARHRRAPSGAQREVAA